MTYEPLNRRLAILAALFAFLGVVLGTIALATNYWTLTSPFEPNQNGTLGINQQQHGYVWNVCIVYFSFS
jgi:hypothetical protein